MLRGANRGAVPCSPRESMNHSLGPLLDALPSDRVGSYPEKVPGVRKIAVLRANAVGDFLFCLPALEALRVAYPEAEIVLLGRSWHVDFLTGRPGPVDRILPIPPTRGINGTEETEEDEAELERFFSAMIEERFDLAFQLHGGGRHSNPFVRRLGARLTIGLRAADAPPLDCWIPYIYFQPEIIRYLEVVALAGARPVTLDPRVTVLDRDLAEARLAVPEMNPPLALLNPGAIDPRRRWPVEHFARVGRALVKAGACVVLNGAGSEEDGLCQTLAGLIGPGTLNPGNRLSLGGLAGLLSRCAVAVSNDSGPLHLAAAVGTATVGIYWCFNLVNSSELTRARHRLLVSWRQTCPVCGKECRTTRCEHTASFVAEVPVEEVTAAALELLSPWVQHTRLDSRQAENALITTIAYGSPN